jgi:arylsulfatase A-like enzyme
MLRAWLPRAAGLLAGASLAAFAAAFVGASPWWAKLMPLAFGNWLAAGVLVLLLLAVCAVPRARARLAPPAAWMWTGVALGLVPLPSAAGLLAPPTAYVVGTALALALAGAARRWHFPAPPVRVLTLIAVLTPPLALAFAFHHDGELEQAMHAAAQQDAQLPATPSAAWTGTSGAPDLILISVDTLRADAVVGPRPPGYELPWFDGLRARGLWWDYALSSSNQTVPGHAAMLTGRDAVGTAVRWNRDLLPGTEHAPLVSERFLAAGYRTLGVISNDLLSGALGFDRGYELYDDSTVPRLSMVNAPLAWYSRNSWMGLLLDDRMVHTFLVETQFFSAQKPPRSLGGLGRIARGTVTTDQAIAALEHAYAQERPFFFFIHYFDPHQPYGAPPPYAGRLTSALPPIAPAYAASKKGGLFGAEEIERAARDLRAEDPAVRAAARAAVQRYHLTYLERIMFLDAELQRLEARLQASGRPYALLLTADHGEHFGEHDAMLHGTTLYEEAIRVPMILTGPGIPAGVRGEGVPALEDVAPTLLALAGIAPPAAMQGRMLAREGAGSAGRAHVAADNKRVSWRLDGWKAHGRWSGEGAADAVALYRVAEDPTEQHDRFAEGLPAALREALTALLARDVYEQSQRAIDFAHAFMLAELGYADAAAGQED